MNSHPDRQVKHLRHPARPVEHNLEHLQIQMPFGPSVPKQAMQQYLPAIRIIMDETCYATISQISAIIWIGKKCFLSAELKPTRCKQTYFKSTSSIRTYLRYRITLKC